MYVFIYISIYLSIHVSIYLNSMNVLDSFLFQVEVVMFLFFIEALTKTVPS
jgi:hypothetical protein